MSDTSLATLAAQLAGKQLSSRELAQTYLDRIAALNPSINAFITVDAGKTLAEAAAASSIPVQHAVFQNYGSDGAELIRRGVETVLLTMPTRYTHSPNEMVTEPELVQCVDLILAYLEREPLPARWHPAG